MSVRIVLIHAVTVAMTPVQEAFHRLWPEAECTNLLDDSLSPDRAKDQELTDAMHHRIDSLADYAVSTGANGILFTCSAFGRAIEQSARRRDLPILKPNEAMFESALEQGDRIGMLATFGPSVAGMEEEFHELASSRTRPDARIRTICIPEAMSALRAGNTDAHNRLLAEAASQLSDCDAVLLAHFSTARAEQAVRAAVERPVLTSPAAAVIKLRAAIERGFDRS
jgi:aspartate/glutamate racemase